MPRTSKNVRSTVEADEPTDPVSSPDVENIDKIRDILFGSQTRQIDKKLIAMDGKIDKEIASLRSETKTTFDTLEQFVRKELQSLSDQLTSEKSGNAESVENLAGKISDTRKTLDKKISQLNDKVIKDQRETQEQILQQAKNLMEEMHQKNDVIQKRLDQSVEELAYEKTDRLTLANLMMEAGMRLKDEFQLPEPE